MKYFRSVFLALAVCCFAVILSCSDNSSNSSPVYDLRTTFQILEEFSTQGDNEELIEAKSKTRGHRFVYSDQVGSDNALRVFSLQQSTDLTKTYTFEYNTENDLFWTKQIVKDEYGNTFSTALQTLDDAGFPTRCIWYDASGDFLSAYDTTYDETLYLMTSNTNYVENPTNNPDAKKQLEYSKEWNSDGVLTAINQTEYDENGLVACTFRWRSTAVKNSLRGAGGSGYYEYRREYDAGALIYQVKASFDSDGFPETFSYDTNGDGIYDEIHQTEVNKTVEGYLSEIVAYDKSTGEKVEKSTFIYDLAGRLKTIKDYEVVEDEFALLNITSLLWYQNPVNGPTGGKMLYFLSDDEGNPLGEYQTIDWTAEQKTTHFYSAPGEEVKRITDTLEKIIVQ